MSQSKPKATMPRVVARVTDALGTWHTVPDDGVPRALIVRGPSSSSGGSWNATIVIELSAADARILLQDRVHARTLRRARNGFGRICVSDPKSTWPYPTLPHAIVRALILPERVITPLFGPLTPEKRHAADVLQRLEASGSLVSSEVIESLIAWMSINALPGVLPPSASTVRAYCQAADQATPGHLAEMTPRGARIEVRQPTHANVGQKIESLNIHAMLEDDLIAAAGALAATTPDERTEFLTVLRGYHPDSSDRDKSGHRNTLTPSHAEALIAFTQETLLRRENAPLSLAFVRDELLNSSDAELRRVGLEILSLASEIPEPDARTTEAPSPPEARPSVPRRRSR